MRQYALCAAGGPLCICPVGLAVLPCGSAVWYCHVLLLSGTANSAPHLSLTQAVACCLPPLPRCRGSPADGRPSFPLAGRLRLVNRGVLAGALVQQCLAQHGQHVRFHFGCTLESLDLAGSSATFCWEPEAAAAADATAGEVQVVRSSCAAVAEGAAAWAAETVGAAAGPAGEGGAAVSVKYDLLVGADGAGSAVRAALAAQDSSLQVGGTLGGGCPCWVGDMPANASAAALPLAGAAPACCLHATLCTKLRQAPLSLRPSH